MTESRRCPSCFVVKRIPVPLPVCRDCIQLVPNKLQSEYCAAVLAQDKKELIRLNGEIVTTAWQAHENTPQMRAERGAR